MGKEHLFPVRYVVSEKALVSSISKETITLSTSPSKDFNCLRFSCEPYMSAIRSTLCLSWNSFKKIY